MPRGALAEIDDMLSVSEGAHVDYKIDEGPPPIPKGLETRAKAQLKILVDHYTEYEGSAGVDQERLYSNFKDFLRVSDAKKNPWRANHTLPIVYNAVRIVWGRLLDAILGSPLQATIEPLGMYYFGLDQTWEEIDFRARLAQSSYNTALDYGEQRKENLMASLDTLIFGRGYLKTGFMTNLVPDGIGGYDVKSEFPKGLRVSPFNLLKDPFCGWDISKAREIHEVLEFPMEAVRLMVKNGSIIKDAFKKISMMEGNATSNVYRQKIQGLDGQSVTKTGYYEFVETSFYWDPDGNGAYTPWTFLWDKESEELLACKENDYDHGRLPYIEGLIMPAPEMPNGIGLAEALHAIQRGSSNTLNHLLENIAAMNMRHLVLEDSLDELALSRSIPNQIIRAQNLDAHKIIQGQGMPRDVWEILNYWQGVSQETSSVTPISMAIKAASTATGTQTLQANAQANFDMVAAILSLSMWQPSHEHLFSNFQQFQDLTIYSKMPGMNIPVPISSDMIQGSFKVKAYDVRTYARKRQRAQDAMGLVSQMVQAQLPANFMWIVQKIFEDMELYEPDQAFKGEIWNPATAQKSYATGGVRGQNDPLQINPTQPGQDTSRLQITPYPGGSMPQDITGDAARNFYGGAQ